MSERCNEYTLMTDDELDAIERNMLQRVRFPNALDPRYVADMKVMRVRDEKKRRQEGGRRFDLEVDESDHGGI